MDIRKGGSYGPEELRRVVAYAAARSIEVVPEIETPGHALALLASHPELSCLASRGLVGATDGAPLGDGEPPRFLPEDRYGVFEDILCAGEEAVFDLMERIVDGLVEFFPGPYVHLGGDEAPKTRWLSCPLCLERMRTLGFADSKGSPEPELLQAWFMGRMGAILAKRGKRMLGWDEILDAEPRGLDAATGPLATSLALGLPKDAIVMSWRGYSGGLAGPRSGRDVVMCPQTKACYLDHKHLDRLDEPGQLGVCTVRDSYSFEPVPAELSPEEARHILGGQANLWGELLYFGKQAEYMAFPRLCAISEALWSPKEGRDFPSFSERLRVHLSRLEALGVNFYRGPLE